MNFLEKLDYLMKKKGLNKSKLSKLSGVPYTTIDGFYKKGYENTKISTIQKIALALDVSLDYLADDSISDEHFQPKVLRVDFGHGEMGAKKAPPLSGEAMRLAKDYDSLDRWGRQALRELAETELQRMEDEKRFKIFSLCFKWSITILCIVCELRKPPCWAVFFYFSQD